MKKYPPCRSHKICHKIFLLNRPVIEARCLNMENILAAAADWYNGVMDLFHICTDNEGFHSTSKRRGISH